MPLPPPVITATRPLTLKRFPASREAIVNDLAKVERRILGNGQSIWPRYVATGGKRVQYAIIFTEVVQPENDTSEN